MSVRFFAQTAIVYVILFAVVPFLLLRLNLFLGFNFFYSSLLSIIGYGVFALGILIIATSFRELFLKPKQSMINPLSPPPQFIYEGIFRFSRNPMYIGYLLIILSEFFLFGALLQIIFLSLAALLIHLGIVYVEEPSLEKRFGKEYLDYKRQVPRWIIRTDHLH